MVMASAILCTPSLVNMAFLYFLTVSSDLPIFQAIIFNAHALDGVCHYYFFHIGQFHVRGVFPFPVFIYPPFPLVFVSCDQCVFLGDVSREKYAHDVSGFSVGIYNERDEFMVYGDFQRLVFS